LLFGILAIFASTAALAGDEFKWDEITGADWSVGEDSARKIFDAAMILERIIADDKNLQRKRYYRTIYRRIRIFAPSGREWGDVDVPLFNTDQKVKEIKGRTILRDGTIIPLEKQHIFEKEAVKTKGFKLKQKAFSMPGVTNDCIIEYMIRYEFDYIEPEWIIQKDIALLRGELYWHLAQFTLTQSEAKMFKQYITPNYLCLRRYSDVNVTQLPNLKNPETLLFEIGFIPAFEEEPSSLPEASLKTRLLCYYGSDEPAEAYWGAQSTEVYDDMAEFCKKNKKLKKVLEGFHVPENDDENIHNAYQWARDSIHNIGYVELKDPKKPEKKLKLKDRDSVDDVIKYGYGNIRQINYVFCDMLREMNIDAKFAFAKDRFEDLFVEDAKFWQFDRSLVIVRRDENQYDYYSPGHAMTPRGQIPWFIEGVTALIGGDNRVFVPVPFSESDDNETVRSYDFTIDEDLFVSGEMGIILKGHPARTLRIEILDEDTVDHLDMLTEEIEGDFTGGEFKLDSCRNLDVCSGPALLYCSLDYEELSPSGNKIFFKPVTYLADSKNRFYASKRKFDILFDYAYKERELAEFALPEGWTVDAIPSDTIFQNAVGTCQLIFNTIDNKIEVQRLFFISQPFFTIDQYPLVRALFQARQDLANLIVVLKEG
jgi:hypothetical protein